MKRFPFTKRAMEALPLQVVLFLWLMPPADSGSRKSFDLNDRQAKIAYVVISSLPVKGRAVNSGAGAK